MISISLCMIVKDEEKVLARCLDSVKDAVDEIIIVDTGSRDGTKEVAGGYTGYIYDFPWQDDFSAARNEAFSKASMEYCMWLDADDVLPGGSAEKLLQLKEELPTDTDMVMMPYEMIFDEKGNPGFSYYRERLVRNNGRYLFQGRVHEAIPISGKVLYREIPVHHRKEEEKDSKRNLKIYQSMEKAGEPFDSRALYYYGKELLVHGQYEKSIRILKKFLQQKEGWVENQIDGTRQLAWCYEQIGEKRKTLQALLKGLEYDVRGQRPAVRWADTLRMKGSILRQSTGTSRLFRRRKMPDQGLLFRRNVTVSCRPFLCASVMTEWDSLNWRSIIMSWRGNISRSRHGI